MSSKSKNNIHNFKDNPEGKTEFWIGKETKRLQFIWYLRNDAVEKIFEDKYSKIREKHMGKIYESFTKVFID